MIKSWQRYIYICMYSLLQIHAMYSLFQLQVQAHKDLSSSLHFQFPSERREDAGAKDAEALPWLLNTEDEISLQVTQGFI